MAELLEVALAAWRDCPASLPPFARAYSTADQAVRERHLDRFLDRIQGEMRHPPRTRPERKAAHARLTGAFAEFGRAALGFEDRHLELMLEGGFSAVGTSLARQARRFDPSVSAADILQASRNAWTACGLQKLLGRSMRLTPAIFAYSMLYPYTDNYLDDPATSAETKRCFSARFGARLAGGLIAPENRYEATIWRLIETIEGEYSRADYPQVFESLLGIHRAQEDSIRLLDRGPACTGDDVLRLGFAKGGASVLVDGYLATGSLTAGQAGFVFDWGVLLQLADDLQDVREDRQAGVRTLFSQAAGQAPLDALTARTLQFGRRAMLRMHQLGAADGALPQLLEMSCVALVVRSAGAAGEFHTRSFLEAIEAQSPFRFAFLDDRRRRFDKRKPLLARLFEAFLAGDDDEPAFPLLPGSLISRI